MEERSKVHVGLDVHKDSISVAAAEPDRVPGRLIGKVPHDVHKLLKVLAKLGTAEQLHIVYEAGPTGFGLQRALQAKGYVCEIIAPSQIPRRPGDRIKTDTRDSVQLAECSRAGQLSAVWIPDPDDEAIRDLSRAREDAVNSRVQARHQLKGFLLRHDVRYKGKTSWCGAYYRWLGTLNFGAGAAQTAFTEYWQAVSAADDRVDRLTKGAAGLDCWLALRTGGWCAAGAAWCRRDHGDWPGGRDRRSRALCPSAQAHGLSRAGSVRAFQRRAHEPRQHH
jgi:transposase